MLTLSCRHKAERDHKLYHIDHTKSDHGRFLDVRRLSSFLIPSVNLNTLRLDYAKQYDTARKVIGDWITEGSLKRQFHVVEGIDKCPEALPLLFNGGNIGKLCVALSCSQP